MLTGGGAFPKTKYKVKVTTFIMTLHFGHVDKHLLHTVLLAWPARYVRQTNHIRGFMSHQKSISFVVWLQRCAGQKSIKNHSDLN